MRPSALTQAARNAAARRVAVPSRGKAASSRHERRPARPGRPPRRVSGPMRRKEATGRTTAALRVTAAARSAAIALPLHPPFRWKRTPKPAVRPSRPHQRTAARQRTHEPPAGLARRIGSFAAALPDHAWLDRVVRGRAWIPLLGVLLAGIVAAQVEILKLGASMGRALEQTTTLTTQNEQLRGSVAQLADGQRIERLAGAMGLVLPPPGAVGYLPARRRGDVVGAVGNIHAPDSAAFVAMTPRNGALVTGPGTSTLPPTPGAPAPPATTTSAATSGTPSAATSTAGTPTASATTPATSTSTVVTTSSANSQSPSSSSQSAATSAPATVTSTSPATTTSSAAAAATQAPAPTSSPGVPATGAAAIQPSGTTQQSGGG